MPALSASTVSVSVGDDYPYREEGTRTVNWRGREIRHIAVRTDSARDAGGGFPLEDQADETMQRLRKVAVEVGR